jgi:uncharacterized membrane protein YphA (DoxX/SURF4 family)
VAAIAALHLAFITFWVLWPAGFAWNRGGWEFAGMWTAVLLYIALKGGGSLSVDRLLFGRSTPGQTGQA